MSILINILIFIFGLILGSFLNCVIYRLKREESFIQGRSYCPHCGHLLDWLDLIPFFSFFFLRGRCRYCHRRISWRYPLVELSTGLGLILIANFVASPVLAVFYSLMFLFLVVIFVFDIQCMLIPDGVVNSAIVISFLFNLGGNIYWGHWSISSIFVDGLIAGAGVFFFLGFIHWVTKKKGLGWGDVKVGALMGLVLGVDKVIVALFLSFVIGAIIGLVLVVINKKEMKSKVPFAPFLVVGTIISMMVGSYLTQWYLNLLS